MPALHLFNRRTIFAGDDLQPASYLTILIRLFETSFLLLPITIHSIREAHFFLRLNDNPNDDDDDDTDGGAKAYLFGGDDTVYPPSCSNYYPYSSSHYYSNYGSSVGGAATATAGGETGHIFPLFLTIYTTTSLLHAISSILTERCIALACSVGSPTEPHRRNPKVARLVERRWLYISIVGNAVLICVTLTALSYRGSYVRCRDYKMNESGYYDGDEGWSAVERYGWWFAWGILGIGQASELCFYSVLLAVLFGKERVGVGGVDPNMGYGFGYGAIDAQESASVDADVTTHHTTTNNHNHHNTHHINTPPNHLSLINNTHHNSSLFYYDDNVDETGTHSSHYQLRHTNHHHQAAAHELTEKLWSARCRSFCRCAAYSTCFLFGGKEIVDDMVGDYGDVARALADYVEDEGVLDIVPSDIAAGLVLLQRIQSQRILEGRRLMREARREGRGGEGEEGRGLQLSPVGVDRSYAGGRDYYSPPSSSMMVRFDDEDGGGGGGGLGNSGAVDRNQQQHHNSNNNNDNNDRGEYPSSLPDIIDNIVSSTDKPASENSSSSSSTSYHSCDNDDTYNNNNNNSNTLALPSPPSSTTSPPPPPPPLTTTSTTTSSPPIPPPRTHNNTTSIHPIPQRLRTALSPHSLPDRRVLAEGARFARHSLAIYTYMLYVYMYPVTGMAHLLAHPLTSRCRRCFRGGGSSGGGGRACCVGGGSGGSGGSEEENHKEPLTRNASQLPSEAVGVSVAGVGGSGGSSGGVVSGGGGGTVRGDNCWRLHTKGLLVQSGLDESDLVYAEFGNRYHHMPYCILVDHKWKSVVVCIRGTLSLEDCVIDVLLEPEPLDNLGREHGFDGDGEFCHKGVVGITKNILDDLERHKILSALLLSDDAPYPDYTLRITGHSLGGATATLLGFILRKIYPTLRVVAISPPGGFISWRLANECKEFVTSFVLNNDLVPRLSWSNMERLRDEVLDLIGRIRVPKAVIAGNILKNGILSCSSADHDHAVHTTHDEGDDDDHDDLDFLIDENAKMLHPTTSSLPSTPFLLQLARTKQIQAARRSLRPTRILLYPPGRIVHLVKTGEKLAPCCVNSCTRLYRCLSCGTSNVGYKYTPVWIRNDELGEIVVSPTMAPDHFPNRVCLELEKVAVEYGVDLDRGIANGENEEGIQII